MDKKTKNDIKDVDKVGKGVTARLACSCKHPYQDSLYGGLRLHNLTKAGRFRCTVCSKEK